jgi:glycogen(starch) synthase
LETLLEGRADERRPFADERRSFADHLVEVPLGPGVPPCATEEEAARQRRELGVREGELLGVYFGLVQAGTGKGLEGLLKAIAGMRESKTRWVCLGGGQSAADGRHQERLCALAGSLGIADRVTWLGYVPDRQVSAVLASADLCVLPYEDGAELHRSSLITALAHRLPLVTTYVGCLPSALRGGDHVLAVPAGDTVELGRAMTRLVTDPGLRARLRANLAELAERFAWPALARRTAALYANVVQRTATAGLGIGEGAAQP